MVDDVGEKRKEENKMKMSKSTAREIIKENKSNTAWYGENNINIFGVNVSNTWELYELFRHRCRLGEAETMCLIGALVLSGAEIEC